MHQRASAIRALFGSCVFPTSATQASLRQPTAMAVEHGRLRDRCRMPPRRSDRCELMAYRSALWPLNRDHSAT